MTRENYDKFLKIAPLQLSKQNELHVMGSGTKYLSEIKVGRKGTLYCMMDANDLNIMNQINVDIFLIDYLKPLSAFRCNVYEKIKRTLMICKLNWDEKKVVVPLH